MSRFPGDGLRPAKWVKATKMRPEERVGLANSLAWNKTFRGAGLTPPPRYPGQKVSKGWGAVGADRNKRVRKAFESHPKYRMQQITMVERRKDGGMYQHGPDTVHQSYKGKSLVLRRPKYQVVAMTSKKPNKGSTYVAHVGPNYRVKRGDALRLQQAYKTKTKKVTSEKGVTFNNKVTKSMDDKNLKRAKRASATLSIGGGTLGLGGLTALAMKKPETAAKMSIGATGVGGIGSYNYAAIQRAEAKKRPPRQSVYVVRNKKQIKNIKSGLEPVTKSGGMMDFGLNDVRHGENVEISKAKRSRAEQNKIENAAYGGMVAAPTATYFGSNAGKAGKAGYKLQRSLGTSKPRAAAAGIRTAGAGIKGAADSGRMMNSVMRHPWLAYGTTIGGAVGAAKVAEKAIDRKKVSKKDWMNISEHERRGRDSRRTAKRGESAAGWGGAAITGAVAHRAGTATGAKYPDMDKQFTGLKSAGKRAKFDYKYGRAAGFDRAASAASGKRELVTAAKKNPHAAVAVGGAALMAGGLATSLAARGNEKRHDRAIAVQRRNRVKKDLVFKAYNPEGKRQRRLDNTSTGLGVASGAAGAGAVGYGVRSSRNLKAAKKQWGSAIRQETARVTAINNAGKGKYPAGSAGAVKSNSVWRQAALTPGGAKDFIGARKTAATAVKNGAKAGGLGLAAVGLAVGSDRVRGYRRGNGGSYRQLHRGI